MSRRPNRPLPPRRRPAPRADRPLPLNYYPRPVPRRGSRGLFLAAAILLAGSLLFDGVGAYVVFRVGRDTRYALLSAAIAPIIFAAGLLALLHALDMARRAVGWRGGVEAKGGDVPQSGECENSVWDGSVEVSAPLPPGEPR